MLKKIYYAITLLLFILIIFIFFKGITTINEPKKTPNYSIPEYTIDATIMKNGDLHIIEKIKYSFIEEMQGLSRDILYNYSFDGQKDDMMPTSSRYQASGMTLNNIYSSDTGYSDMQPVLPAQKKEELDWLSRYRELDITDIGYKTNIVNGYEKQVNISSYFYKIPANTNKYIQYNYTLHSVAVKYNDYGEIYWNFIANKWDVPIKNANINLKFESENITDNLLKDVKLYPHSYSNISSPYFGMDFINFTSNKINLNNSVDIRIIFNNSCIPNATKQINQNYDWNLLKKIENSMSFDKFRYLLNKFITIIIYIAMAIVTLIVIRNVIRLQRKGRTITKPNSTIPSDKLALSEYIVLIGGKCKDPNLFLATLLDLINKEYITMRAEKKNSKAIKYDYFLKINPNKDFEMLSKYENLLLNYLFAGVGRIFLRDEISSNNIEINLDKKLKLLKKSPKNVVDFSSSCDNLDFTITSKLKNNTEGKYIYSQIFKVSIVIFILFVINIFLISPVISSVYSKILPMMLMIIYLFIMPLVLKINTVNEEYLVDKLNILSLKKYLTHYSTLKDKTPIELVLWNNYLVFASLLGIANKVEKEFNVNTIQTATAIEYVERDNNISFFIDEYRHYRSSIRSATIFPYSQTVDSNTSGFSSDFGSSSSGGFFGGGSGGGRRRPAVAVVLFKLS
ncbi:MAG: DUF2207 domain-containing protein, partial [Clostridia bacterium]